MKVLLELRPNFALVFDYKSPKIAFSVFFLTDCNNASKVLAGKDNNK